jgi:ribonuclease E
MLIDATHPEETRVAVVDGTRLEEFDFEMAARRQIKSNIYLAKVTRVEPSLQAAFVEYGGNRHGFLPFPEIHPDYYRIPVSDRASRGEPEERWVDTPYTANDTAQHDAAESDAAENAEWADAGRDSFDSAPESTDAEDAPAPTYGESSGGEHSDGEALAREPWDGGPAHGAPSVIDVEDSEEADTAAEADAGPRAIEPAPESHASPTDSEEAASEQGAPADDGEAEGRHEDDFGHGGGTMAAAASADPSISDADSEPYRGEAETSGEDGVEASDGETETEQEPVSGRQQRSRARDSAADPAGEVAATEITETVDIVGGDEVEDAQRRRRSQMPHYKIQEVIKRRQIMLVQISKEERGNKGAAVTTFLSLPGRYCVLMPNTARGGGVSRKIANPTDRKRMKELISDLDVPEGMSVILRTAGVERSKAEIKRDLEYLLRLWENIRTLTLESTAPALIYEEGNLVKRAIRDLYTRDIDSIEIAGEEGYRQAKDFMRMLMPSHAKRVQPYRDPSIPLFFRYQVESQIDLIHNPVAHLKSGGYIVINQTEALVSIDVNSGRSTRERNIEETALKTNCEAADEIARQLRLRDMGGLIVIDFIDMDEPRHDAQVERRLKEAMKNDRARIQVGRISPFGLLELSRQRLHPSLIETHFQTCAHCLGTGLVRSIESASLLVLRAIEEEGIKRRSAELAVTVAGNIALYILNQKRGMLIDIEQRYGFSVRIMADDSLIAPEHKIERIRLKPPGSELPPLSQTAIMAIEPEPEDDDLDESDEAETLTEAAAGATDEAGGAEGDRKRKRRRSRRRRGRDDRPEDGRAEDGHEDSLEAQADGEGGEALRADDDEDSTGDDAPEALAEGTAEAAGEGGGLELGTADASETPAEGARRRRRGRRGGRSRSRREDGRVGALGEPDETDDAQGVAADAAYGDAGDDDLAPFAGSGSEEVETFGGTAFDEHAHAVDAPIAETVPTQDAPTHETPTYDTPAHEAPMHDAPADSVAADEAPAGLVADPHEATPETEPAVAAPVAATPEAAANDSGSPKAATASTTAAASSEPAPTPPKPVAREFEVVNQPPAQPRRGFWKRFVE